MVTISPCSRRVWEGMPYLPFTDLATLNHGAKPTDILEVVPLTGSIRNAWLCPRVIKYIVGYFAGSLAFSFLGTGSRIHEVIIEGLT